jgi:hypothetical protein
MSDMDMALDHIVPEKLKYIPAFCAGLDPLTTTGGYTPMKVLSECPTQLLFMELIRWPLAVTREYRICTSMMILSPYVQGLAYQGFPYRILYFYPHNKLQTEPGNLVGPRQTLHRN